MKRPTILGVITPKSISLGSRSDVMICEIVIWEVMIVKVTVCTVMVQ